MHNNEEQKTRDLHEPREIARTGVRRERPQLSVGLARGEQEIRAAKKLRYQVFAEEMGARLKVKEPGVDHDIFDPYCEHLVARDERTGEVVGTYRILTPENARRLGGYYSETEFDLTRLQHIRPRMVELGRSCVHADYRSGATIALLWGGLADFMQTRGYEWLVGCASISMADGGHNAATLFGQLQDNLSPLDYRVFPRHALPVDALRQEGMQTSVPPLIKGYLRAGAWICGAPAWDPDFNTADLPILLSMQRVEGRYARHFVER